MIRVAFRQQGKACFCKFKGILHLLRYRRQSFHGQTRPLRGFPCVAFHARFARQQIHQRLHQDACPCTDDVLPGGGIPRVPGRFQPKRQPLRTVEFIVSRFDHRFSFHSIIFARARVSSDSAAPVRGCFGCAAVSCAICTCI